jgi:histidinol-phosphate phosphatase family protein
MTHKAVFLDRDGTINEEVSYLSSIEQLNIIPRAAAAVKLLNDNRFKVIIITNQSGVARNYFSEDSLKQINEHLMAELSKEGATIHEVYYCPHHPDTGCGCRKPNTGNIEKAAMEHDLDLANSYMVGDTIRDMETGFNANLRTVLVLTGYGEEEWDKYRDDSRQPDFVARDLYEASDWIIRDKA